MPAAHSSDSATAWPGRPSEPARACCATSGSTRTTTSASCRAPAWLPPTPRRSTCRWIGSAPKSGSRARTPSSTTPGGRRPPMPCVAAIASPASASTVLYAPTYRGEQTHAARDPELLDLGVLREMLGDDHLVLVRMHPFVRQSTAIGPELSGFAVDVSDHPDIHALMLVSDHLVTDYSSAIFEYSLLGRPITLLRARPRRVRARARLLPGLPIGPAGADLHGDRRPGRIPPCRHVRHQSRRPVPRGHVRRR